jgi:hypothetical protein
VELRDLFLPNTIRVIKSRRVKWLGHVARVGERRGAFKVLVVKREKNIPLGRHRRIWEGNTGMDIERPFGRLWTVLFWFLKRTSEGLL